MTILPVGGTTGCDHHDNPAIEEAGRWLASTPREWRPRPIIPALCERFGISPKEACAAIKAATLAEARAM
jgi:hypothetical protein